MREAARRYRWSSSFTKALVPSLPSTEAPRVKLRLDPNGSAQRAAVLPPDLRLLRIPSIMEERATTYQALVFRSLQLEGVFPDSRTFSIVVLRRTDAKWAADMSDLPPACKAERTPLRTPEEVGERIAEIPTRLGLPSECGPTPLVTSSRISGFPLDSLRRRYRSCGVSSSEKPVQRPARVHRRAIEPERIRNHSPPRGRPSSPLPG